MITPADIQLVQSTFGLAVTDATKLTSKFYQRLFELDPSLRVLFPVNLSEQGDKLAKMLSAVIGGLDDLERIVPAAQALAVRHLDYGVEPGHYDTVGTALLDTLGFTLGSALSADAHAAWAKTYDLLSDVMKKAAYEF